MWLRCHGLNHNLYIISMIQTLPHKLINPFVSQRQPHLPPQFTSTLLTLRTLERHKAKSSLIRAHLHVSIEELDPIPWKQLIIGQNSCSYSAIEFFSR